MHLQRHRYESIAKVLNHYIPNAAAFGVMLIGALTILADFLRAMFRNRNFVGRDDILPVL